MKNNIKITDNFVWLLVTEKAKEVFNSGLFAMFTLYEDNTEALIENSTHLNEALEKGLDIGIEVGHINITIVS
jgi:hypothetical protein